jgi:capsular polysaccharide biosynthesis protein
MPPIATALYQKFGFDVISSDGPVRGRNYFWSVSHTQVVHSGRQQLIAPFMSQFGRDLFPRLDLPRRIFLSRRGTRSLLNEGEVEALLSARGFTKIYAEDLTLDEQFALWREATDVVAIHGAGMAPMQYRSPDAPTFRLVELAPVGWMTRWFGIMCEQVGGKYIGVRARSLPEYIDALYDPAPFLNRCDDDFAIDPRSLEVALETIAKDSGRQCAVELYAAQ